MESSAELRQLPPGTMLDDKYRIDSLLAIGGMGAVYVGTHVKLRKRVAIKVLNPELSSPPMIERFHREAITASQIGHEGIAQVTDLGTSSEGEPFLVMELLEGESLSKRLKTTGALPIDVACELACAILSPLEAAHRAGIVHRDLKPDNVFLVRQSRGEMVKLLDFGISRAAGLEGEFRLTTTGLVLGTPYYMSPEQARGDAEISRAADIYSLGVMLYEMVIGTIPITGDNYNQLMYKVMMGDYARPRERRPDVPVELENVIVAAMSLNPEARPRSAAELEQTLLPFCRPTFREYTIERISAPGFAPILTPQPLSRSGAPPPGFGSGVDKTVLAPTPAPTQVRTKKGLLIAVLAVAVIGGGIAAVAIGVGGSPSEPVTAAPVAKPTVTPIAQPVTPTPAPTAPAGSAAKVTVKFAITPPDAEIEVDGKRAAADQIVVDKDDAAHHVHITAAGFQPHDEDIKFDESQRLTIALVAQQKTAATPAAKPPPHTPNKKPDKIESKSPYD